LIYSITQWKNYHLENIFIEKEHPQVIRALYHFQGIDVISSRGSFTYLVKGKETDDALFSLPHGSGRRMNRSKALSSIKAHY